MIEFLIITCLAGVVLLAMLELEGFDLCATFGLSKKYRIKVIGGNVYIPQYKYLILWNDILSLKGSDYEDAQEWARSVIAKDKARELRAKDIKYIDIK